MTFVQIINQVLVRLRESTVTDYNDSEYSTLIAALVNDSKEQIEDLWDWTALRTDLTFNTVATQTTYAITGSNERTRILRVFNTDDDYIIRRATDAHVDRHLTRGTPATSSAPPHYRLRGISAAGLLQMDLEGTPTAIKTILVPSVVPQAELAASATILTIPSKPVMLTAVAMAFAERGEQFQGQVAGAEAKASRSVASAIQLDTSRVAEEIVWRI